MKTWRINVWTSTDKKTLSFSTVVEADSKDHARTIFASTKEGRSKIGHFKTISLERRDRKDWGRTGW